MEQRRKMIARREEIIAQDPELGKFVLAKSKWIKILMLAGFILQIGMSFTSEWSAGDISLGDFLGDFLFGLFLGYWKYFIVLYSCSGSMKYIKIAGVIEFCIWANYLGRIYQQTDQGRRDLPSLAMYQELFQIAPWIVILGVLAIIYDLIIAGTILCLLAVPKNRNRIKQFDDLMDGTKPGMSETARRTVD